MNLIKPLSSGLPVIVLSAVTMIGCASNPAVDENIDAPPAEQTESNPASAEQQAANSNPVELEPTADKELAVNKEPSADKEPSASKNPSADTVSAAVKEDAESSAEQKTEEKPVDVPVVADQQKQAYKPEQKAKPEPKSKSKLQEKVAKAKVPVKAEKPKKDLTKNALNVSKKDLPVRLKLWSLGTSYQEQGALVLKTPTMQMGDGDFYSQVWLTLTSEKLEVNSSSDIDENLAGIGVRVNGGDLIPFDRIQAKNAGVLEGDWINKLSEGGELEIMLGFFPDKDLDSPVFKRVASINDLSSLVPTYYKLK